MGPKNSYKCDLTNLLIPLIMLSLNHQNHKRRPKWDHVPYTSHPNKCQTIVNAVQNESKSVRSENKSFFIISLSHGTYFVLYSFSRSTVIYFVLYSFSRSNIEKGIESYIWFGSYSFLQLFPTAGCRFLLAVWVYIDCFPEQLNKKSTSCIDFVTLCAYQRLDFV